MTVVVIGAGGQLGSELIKAFKSEAVPLAHEDIEVSDIKSCGVLKKIAADAIINTAAFHNTDGCEDQPEKTFAINAIGAKNIADITQSTNSCAVYISTDYVFDGGKGSPYIETDCPNPINTYGISKLAGEFYTRMSEKHYIFRVSGLFGVAGSSGKGGNFVETMVKKANNNEEIKVVDDVIMSPTYTNDAANMIKDVLEKNLPYGIYHVTNSGNCSWYEFAQAIFDNLGLEPNLSPIKTSSLDLKIKRPEFSALLCRKIESHNLKMRDWKSALRGYLKEKGHL